MTSALPPLRDFIDHYDHGIVASADLDPLRDDSKIGAALRMNLSTEDKDAL